MLIERLQAAVNDAAHLSPEAQEAFAAQIESVVRNAIWDAQLDDPRYDHVLRQMVEEAEQDEWLPIPPLPRAARAAGNVESSPSQS